MTVRKGLFMGMAGVALLSTQAMALPVGDGLNSLFGASFGLDENYVSDNGVYVMPNGAISGVNGTVGMTESISADAGVASGFVLNLPQPANVAATNDSRATVNNPLTGAPNWGARTGGVIGWQSISDGVNTTNLLTANGTTPYDVTGVVHNLTPGEIIAVSGPLLNQGGAPGSVGGDAFNDRVDFVTAFSGQRSASITVTFLGAEDAAPGFFEGGLPSALIGRINLYEGGAEAGFGPIPPGTQLEESDFNHNTGELTDSLAAFDDGDLLLTGSIFNANATLTWTEVDNLPDNPANPASIGFQQSGRFELDIQFGGSVVYDGGSLFDQIANIPQQSISARWNDIPFAVGTNGLDFNGLDVFDFRGGGPNIGGDFSASETFNVGGVIPEPLTAGLGTMALASLATYMTRRRRA